MHSLTRTLSLSLTIVAVFASLTNATITIPRKPVVFYHGMGDSAHSEGMMELIASVTSIDPNVFTHSIYLAASEAEDQRAGFFGNVNKQIEAICDQLKAIPELEGGFNAVGFSQGGQFLRAYVQRCNNPPIHNLVTVGSQHGGVSDIPGCVNPDDGSCKLMRTIARSGVYSGYVRDHIVQAQYYKDPKKLDTYLERNIFLPDINNELAVKNEEYKERLKSLNKFVMFMFMNDVTVRPKETGWFGFQDENGDIIELEEQDQYKEDWLGLKTMDKAGKLEFEVIEGEHMQFSLEEFTDRITIPYLLGIQEPEEAHLEKDDKQLPGDFQSITDQTENDDAFEFPILDGQTVL
ncbi:hypothetical protein EC957_010467 [Mortierella hygrophila]|uniref:Palmitoyl-protein thioesterase 1 n=1 Tax=Mortierella hygrophila TaxID=979708 RepID=A0A9P6F928_9FUNG|nr:hypothetical protein EC957_010467 [Mortierella hygrophila]